MVLFLFLVSIYFFFSLAVRPHDLAFGYQLSKLFISQVNLTYQTLRLKAQSFKVDERYISLNIADRFHRLQPIYNCIAAQNTGFSPIFLLRKFYGNAQFQYSFLGGFSETFRKLVVNIKFSNQETRSKFVILRSALSIHARIH